LLYDATEGVAGYTADRPKYWSRANDMARAFKSKIFAHPLSSTLGTNASLWRYWDNMGSWDNGHYYETTQEDLSHSGLTMSGVMEAYNHGQVFSAVDMEKFTRTFTDVMWNQSLTDPVISGYNSRQPKVTADKTSTSQFNFWTMFAQIDPKVWEIADAVCRVDDCRLVVASGVAKWSPNKAVNSNFEHTDPADVTLPQHWKRKGSTSATAALTTTDPGSFDQSFLITTNGTTWQILEQKLENYEPNTPYTISFLGKKYGTVPGRVQLYDYTTLTVLGQLSFYDTNWTRKQFMVTTPVAGHDVRLRLYSSSLTPAGEVIGFDDVHAYPSLSSGEIGNAGFENANRWDSTLPDYWTRGTSTVSNNAVLDTTSSSAGVNSAKLISTGSGTNQELTYTWLGYKPNTTYTVSYDAKVSGSAGGKLQVINTTTGTVLVNETISATSWTTGTASFTSPVLHTNELKIVLTHNNPSTAGTLWFDELYISSN
jgi:hypothetical protein